MSWFLTLQAYSVDFQGNSLPNTSWSIIDARKVEADKKPDVHLED